MSGIATAVVASTVVSGVMSSNAQQDAAETAANAQIASSDASISESKRQFNAIQELLKPYTSGGANAFGAQEDLLGLNGYGNQEAAIAGIANGPEMQALLKQGENSILQNASATGNLRGGNVQAALGQFSPQVLNQLIQQRFANLGGLSSVGQNAAAGVGNAGMNSSNQIITALTNSGNAQANAAIASGTAQANMWNNIGGAGSQLGTLKLLGKF